MVDFINDIRKDELDLSYENISKYLGRSLEEDVRYTYAYFYPHPTDKAISFTCEEENFSLRRY